MVGKNIRSLRSNFHTNGGFDSINLLKGGPTDLEETLILS